MSEEELLSISFDNPGELDSIEIKNIVSDFLAVLNEKRVISRSYISTPTLEINEKKYYMTDTYTRTLDGANIKVPIYKVNITNNNVKGVAYVSGDERYPQVISYIPEIDEDENVFFESGAVFLTEWAKASAWDEINKVEQIKVNYRSATIAKISRELGIPELEVTYENIKNYVSVNGNIISRATPIQTPTTQVISGVYPPLVPVKWNQTSPYNRLLPVPTPPATQAHVYTGCAVTAIAQLLTACKPTLTIEGISIDWAYLTETETISTNAPADKLDMLGKLFKWIYNEVDAMPNYNENGEHTGTGVYTSMSSAFLSTYLYSSDMISYDPDVLLSSIQQRKPSWISGQNHAFVIDGYLICRKPHDTSFAVQPRANIVLNYDMYWHVNLGWGGSYNGYYKLNPDTNVDIEAGSHTYSTQYLRIQPNLSKKN